MNNPKLFKTVKDGTRIEGYATEITLRDIFAGMIVSSALGAAYWHDMQDTRDGKEEVPDGAAQLEMLDMMAAILADRAYAAADLMLIAREGPINTK